MNLETPNARASSAILSPVHKTALVLSGGGLFGAYQVGAWQYLSEAGFRPDFVIGASVGAINGWSIAGGCDAGDLANQWLDETRSNVLLRHEKPSFRNGFFDREPLRKLTDRVFSDYAPSEKFGLVLVELPFLRSRLITGPYVTSTHLLATASIPVAMPPVSIDGRAFTDGGTLEDVPLWAAAAMGATRIVAVDAMHFECPWWYRVGVGPMAWLAPRVSSALRAETTVIRPRRPLGPYREAIDWKRNRIQDWLERGYADARQAFAHQSSAARLIA